MYNIHTGCMAKNTLSSPLGLGLAINIYFLCIKWTGHILHLKNDSQWTGLMHASIYIEMCQLFNPGL